MLGLPKPCAHNSWPPVLPGGGVVVVVAVPIVDGAAPIRHGRTSLYTVPVLVAPATL